MSENRGFPSLAPAALQITPLFRNDQRIITSEGNGTRLLRFQDGGALSSTVGADNHRRRPDLSSPVLAGDHRLCVNRLIDSLSLSDNLKAETRIRDAWGGECGAIIADHQRALVANRGEV